MLKKSQLHNYQNKAVDHIIENDNSGLFLDMGLGKTISTLTAINELIYGDLSIETVLIIAPKRVVESVWDIEATKWEHTKHIKFSKIIGNEKQRKAALRVKADVYLVSRDNVAWLCAQYGGKMLPFDMLVIDELSSFKSAKSNRFKALRHVRASFKRIVGLTGTPAPNSLIDLWAQLYLLDGGKRLGQYIGQYRERYFKKGRTNGHIVFDYKVTDNGEQQIYKQIEDICISMKAEDYLDLPARIDNPVELYFYAKQKETYDKFERDAVLEFLESEKEVTALNAAALTNKLLQFANGAVYDEDRHVHEIHDLKIEALKEIIEDANGQPVLVAYAFQHDKTRIMEKLAKYSPRVIENNQDIEDWNNGKIQVAILHPASGGHGLNIQKGGNIIVWFGLTWSLELYQQFNARLHRQGQTKSVVINHLIVKGTTDEDVMRALNTKADKQEALMAAVKARLTKYEKFFR